MGDSAPKSMAAVAGPSYCRFHTTAKKPVFKGFLEDSFKIKEGGVNYPAWRLR
jgi:hypothetical protein